MRVAARARDRERVKLRRLVRDLLVRAVGVKALPAAAIDLLVERAVGTELVDAEQRDLRILGMARALRRVRRDGSEAPAVRQEIVDLERLVAHADHVAVEPGLVDPAERRLVHGLHVDAVISAPIGPMRRISIVVLLLKAPRFSAGFQGACCPVARAIAMRRENH